MPSEAVRVAAPPTVPPPVSSSIIATLFPVVGGVGIVGFALIYGNSAFLWIAGGMVTLLVAFSFGMRWSQKRGVRKRAAHEARRYSRYLKDTEHELADSGDLQRAALARLYPESARLWSRLVKRDGVWERRPDHRDFLRVRVGTGTVALERPVEFDLGFNPLTEYQQIPLKDAKKVVARGRNLRGQPVTVDLGDARLLSVCGAPERTRAWARSLLVQLAGARAPHDLRIVTAFDPAAAGEWEWGKWLPHQRLEGIAPGDGGGPPLPVLALARSARELEALLDGEVRPRAEQLRRLAETQTTARDGHALVAPELVVVVDGYRPDHPINDAGAFRELLANAEALRAVVVLLVEGREQEPSHIEARMTLPDRGRATFARSGPDGPVHGDIEADATDVSVAEAIARTLAPLRLKEGAADGARSLAAEVRLLELLGMESADELEVERAQRRRPRSETLRVPVGIGEDGEALVLDLKQAAEHGMGPHGILVGATGSGKSELLRSIVAGLAATHDPETLSFVLVDFKGGAAFAELSRLPHVAGLITNLQRDLSLVDRMHEALIGEQERRQAMLRDAGNLDDARAYRERRDQDPSLPPMPDLLVIVDEFAELLAARPEFIELFVGLGRVGRSLGIHLLLSSQRLDEGRLRGLESHLRYRICLRTYSAVESKLVIGTQDAYLLPSLPGLGYLKVDTSVMRKFRAALVSGAHRRPVSEPVEPRGVRPFEASVAGPLQPAPPPAEDVDTDRTDLDVVVERLVGDLADAPPVHQVWVPPLPPAIALDAVEPAPPWWAPDADRHEGLRVAVGELDRPAEQRTEPLVLDLSGAGGHVAVVGAPRTGKTTLLRSLVLSLARAYTPAQVRFYGIDLGGGGLAALDRLPHVGGIAGRLDREAVERVVHQLQAELHDREALLREEGIESIADARIRRVTDGPAADGRLADVFLVVDGWALLRREFEDLEREIEAIASAGLALGVHVVVGANRWAEMRQALVDNLGTRLELKLNDPLDSDVSRKSAEALPEDVPGRGLTGAGMTFQAALPRVDGVAGDEGLADGLAAALGEVAARWEGPDAEPIRMLPALVDPATLPLASAAGGVPVGLEERTLGPWAVDLIGSDGHLLAFGDAGSGKSSLLRLLARGLAQAHSPEELRIVVVDVRRSLLDLSRLPHVEAFAPAAPAAANAAADLAARLAERVPSDVVVPGMEPEGHAWDGPRYVVLCDDYDLVTSATGSPLQPLVDLLPLGAEIGLHLVLARRVAGSARGAFEPVLSRVRELGAPALIFDGDAAEGPLAGGVKARSLPPGRALAVRRGAPPVAVQVALSSEVPSETILKET